MLCPTIQTDRLTIRRYKESDIDMQHEFLYYVMHAIMNC